VRINVLNRDSRTWACINWAVLSHAGSDGSWVMCTYGTFLHLHPTYGTRRLACLLYLLCHQGLINSKNLIAWESNRDLEEGMHGLYHCTRCLVVLTCLWSHYSIIFSVWMPYSYRSTYIRYSPSSGNKFVPVRLAAVAAESPSLVLVSNDTKLLMPCVKWFKLGISNTCDEGACGMEW
jgi:hypothetical protein